MTNERRPTAFLAYASGVPALQETIEDAARRLNDSNAVEILSWTKLQIGGRILISTICAEIDQRDIFIADITQLNSNVLFELGYAIARNRRIWLMLDGGVDRPHPEVRGFQLLNTIGYRTYNNQYEIETAFHDDRPYMTLDHTTYRDLLHSIVGRPENKLLYLRSLISTDASIKLSRRIDRSRLPSTTDDPTEARIQRLSWYAEHTRSAIAIVAHLLSQSHKGWQYHNAKISFVCGMAHGFNQPVLMLAHAPYESPLDYQDMLITHNTAAQCMAAANGWLDSRERDCQETRIRIRDQDQKRADYSTLQDIALGDPIAEHETDTLGAYFIETAAYKDALVSKYSIFIGRKGTGKTASLFQLAEELSSDMRNHICIVKPVAYEMDGLLCILADVSAMSERGYLLESLWKFLIYTELAKSYYENLELKPAFYERTISEEDFIHLVDAHRNIILSEFSVRLENAVTALQHIQPTTSAQSQRLSISELLHGSILPQLRTHLGKVLSIKERVAVLVDNLDKAWDPQSDVKGLGDFIFSLLSVGERITEEFQKTGHWRRPVKLSITVFLRSDIYTQIRKFAKEKDKLPVRTIVWDDRQTLRRVIEQRFVHAGNLNVQGHEIWQHFFCPTIDSRPTAEFVVDAVLPKPRDLIYLVKCALSLAVNRKHSKIEEEDVLKGLQQYSRYALDVLLVENAVQIDNLEGLIYELVGGPRVVTRQILEQAAHTAGVTAPLEDVVDALVAATFLGIEAAPGQFVCRYDEEDKLKFEALSRKIAPDINQARLEINVPFRSYLEIRD